MNVRGFAFLRTKPPAGVDPPVLAGDPAGRGSNDRGFPCKERMVKMGPDESVTKAIVEIVGSLEGEKRTDE